MSGMGAAEAM